MKTQLEMEREVEEIERLMHSEGVLNYELSAEEIERSPIRNYFKGKTVFLTGGTGFIGQLLMEKLIRCEVKMVYMLARPKKNKTPHERLNDIFEEIQFVKLRKGYPNYRQHVSIVEGDLSNVGLGIKETDRQLLEETVEIILHAAADVRFNDSLYDLIIANLRGTRQMLQMAEEFKKLQIFHYISTAYSNCKPSISIIKETFYEPPIDPNVLIAFAEQCNNNPEDLKIFNIITDRLIGSWPNTYTFSKCLSEELVRRSAEKFPTCVSRPSIVISTNREPIPGWINNIYGITGALTSQAAGLSRMLPIHLSTHIDIICADFTINAVLASTWALHQDIEAHKLKSHTPTTAVKSTVESSERERISVTAPSPKVFAVVASKQITAAYIMRETLANYSKYPLQRLLWTLCVNFCGNLLLFKYLSIYYHLLASLAIDFGLKILGRKERILPLARKVQVFLNALAYFMQYEWKFENGNMRNVWERMDPIDQKLFLCDTRLFDYKKWCLTYIQGMKYHICKDSLRNQEASRVRYKRFQMVHYFVRFLFYISQVLIVYLLLRGFGILEVLKNIMSIKFGVGKTAV